MPVLDISDDIDPAFVMDPPAAIATDDPDNTLKLFAVNVKSSAPAISTSIWSSEGEEIVVSPSVSNIIPSAVPFISTVVSFNKTPSIVTPVADVVSAIVSVAIVLPDNAVSVFAVIWKSSAPAIAISIWSSVSAVIVVSASASTVKAPPFKSNAPAD